MAIDNLISRGIWIILQPGNFLILLLIIGLLFLKLSQIKQKYHKAGMRLIVTATIMLSVVGFTNLSSWAMWPLESRMDSFRNKLDQQPYAGIIVLGGSEKLAISTSSGQPTLNHGGERLMAAAALARKFPTIPIIHSGGTRFADNELSENDVAKLFFEQEAIDISRLRFDSKSYNTSTNAIESKALIKPGETGKWLLVTSAFHMPRSVGNFQKAGINIQPYPVDYKSTLKYDGIFMLNFSENIMRFDLAIHEYIGLLAYYITGRSKSLYPTLK
ncbi:MAG: YdcF family protein [Alphaproteobacteria bacterium]|nr:YdcF family protein [Alphaproteobacteria bacterium]